MTQLPFQISVKCKKPALQTHVLVCKALLRCVPKVRDVYDADWNGRAVIVKIFSDTFKASYHIKREWDGLNLLKKLGIAAPEPLFFGKTSDGRSAIVSEKISDSKTALDIFKQAVNKEEKLKVLIEICRSLARQNSRGILQKDIHLGNFLFAGEKVFSIDPFQIRFFSKALTKGQSISQLSILCSYLLFEDVDSVRRLLKEYFDERKWKCEESDERLLLDRTFAFRKEQIKKSLQKSLRTGTRQVSINNRGIKALFDRSFLNGISFPEFLEKIDSQMDSGRVLKKGNTCFVSRLSLNGRDIVIKRYNDKGFFYSVRNTIKGSRARRSWFFGQLLGMLSVPAPRPLGFIEVRRGLLIVRSYIITEFVNGVKLFDLLKCPDFSEQKRLQVKQKMLNLLDKLGFYNVTHGDLKHTNILLKEDRLFLTDLDSMRLHKFNFLYNMFRKKDIELFKRGRRDGDVIF
jgi:tRNA A-37 threonylcarbamoyl transferase component Bud32